MSLENVTRQKSGQLELALEARGEAPEGQRSGEARSATHGDGRSEMDHLMEEVVRRRNVLKALRRVRQNKGSPGVDGMTVDELPKYLMEHWKEIRSALLTGTYQPQPVRRQRIPKSDGEVRELGIPCVLDRLIQQAILQVLQPRFDPTFSDHSFGFRPGRSAHDAVREAQGYIQESRRWVVDVDLERFFDRVNHDVLMGRLAKRIGDKRMLKIIRRYLEAGVLAEGITAERHEGTPQGGPLSPLLANILLDEVDKALEQRGHTFVRYADDCNVYVRSKRSGERVMDALKGLYSRLRLRINEEKSAVDTVWRRKFLGYSFWVAKGGKVKRRVADKALKAMKERVRQITRRTGGRSLERVTKELGEYLRGWKGYFSLSETSGIFRSLDEWIRRRIRMVQLKQWKTGRTAYREFLLRGVPPLVAARACTHIYRWWLTAGHLATNMAMPNRLIERMGVPRLADAVI